MQNHMVDIHTHDSNLHPECEHGDLTGSGRDWMEEGELLFVVWFLFSILQLKDVGIQGRYGFSCFILIELASKMHKVWCPNF